jgi:hypothetical protein
MQEEFFKPINRKDNFERHDEHSKRLLEAGVNPIMACIGSGGQFLDSPKEDENYLLIPHIDDKFGLGNMQNVDWSSGGKFGEGFLNGGPASYVISPDDGSNKFSLGFFPCTGLIVAGITEDGQKLSFLTHQQPSMTLSFSKDKFMKDLEARLLALKGRCVFKTIDAVIIGGDDFDRLEYIQSIKLLGVEVKKILDFEPVVINGPKSADDHYSDDVYYDNEHRRLYFLRKKINTGAKDVIPSKIRK